MSSLQDLPPELLIQVLTYLPIRSLLQFSETSRFSHKLAVTSLHTLNLGVYPSRVARSLGDIAASSDPSDRSISLLIPDVEALSESALFAFHSKLISTLLHRHSTSLRHLTLRLWTLSPAIAAALVQLSGLRSLTLRIDNPFGNAQRASRSPSPASRRPVAGFHAAEERIAWLALAHPWPSLRELRIDGGDGSVAMLQALLTANPRLDALWIADCPRIDPELFVFLTAEWEGRARLKELGFEGCHGLEMEHLDMVGGMESLQVGYFFLSNVFFLIDFWFFGCWFLVLTAFD